MITKLKQRIEIKETLGKFQQNEYGYTQVSLLMRLSKLRNYNALKR
jgi:hypothetical protein